MNLSIQDNYLVIETNHTISEPYLRAFKGGYRAYWHFVRDFCDKYAPDVSEEFRDALKIKVREINTQIELLHDDIDVSEYSKYLNDPYVQYDFQAKAVRFICCQKRVLLADDTGLGKTLIAITTILHLLETQNKTKFLVVVPASLRLQWLSECREFINKDMFPDLEFILNNKDKKIRRYAYKRFKEERTIQIMITSYDLIRRDKDYLKDFHVDMIIADECQKIKCRTTKINKAFRKLFMDVEYKLCMTATPIENGLEDMYAICEFVDKARLGTKGYFTEKYCVIEKKRLWHRGITIEEVVGYKNIDDAKEKLQGIYIRRTIDDVALELPELISQNIVLELKPEQRKLYKEVKGDIYGDMTREDLLGQLIYLQEVCNSTELIQPEVKVGIKVDEIKRLLAEDLKYSKVILITRFKKFVNILKRELKKFKPLIITGDVDQESRQYTIAEFNASKDRRVLIGTEAMQEGLNLQISNILINCDLPWNPSKFFQRIGRIRRIGSEHKNVRVINLLTKDTMEERVLEVVYKKGLLFEKMFDKDEDVKIDNLLSMSRDEMMEMV